MKNPHERVNGWAQMVMLPPEAVEITARIGYVSSTDHLQLQVEVHDATSKELLALQSWPHIPHGILVERTGQFLDAVLEIARQHIDPF